MVFLWMLIVLFTTFENVYCLTIGSNTTPSRQGAVVFPASGTNTLQGFCWDEGGFILQNASTTLTYDAVFPVFGPVALTGGKMWLNQDLILNNTLSFTSAGIIQSNNRAIYFPSGFADLGATNNTFTFNFLNTHLNFESSISFRGTTVFQGNCIINGNGNLLYLDPSAAIVIDRGASLLMKNITVTGINGSLVRCVDSVGTLTLQDVTWVQNGTYTFTLGKIDVVNCAKIKGTGKFVYQSSQQSTIRSYSQLFLDDGMTFSYDSVTTSKNLIAMTDVTSRLYLNNATLFSTSTGIQLTKGTLTIDGASSFASDARVEAEGIMFGDGTAANDLNLEIRPGAQLSLTSGFLAYNNTA